jgi:hypothetical protein
VAELPPTVRRLMPEVEALAAQTGSRADRINRWGDGSLTRIVAEPGGTARVEVFTQPQHLEPPHLLVDKRGSDMPRKNSNASDRPKRPAPLNFVKAGLPHLGPKRLQRRDAEGDRDTIPRHERGDKS